MINMQQSPPLLIRHINRNRLIIVTKYRIIYMMGANNPINTTIISNNPHHHHFIASTLLVQPHPIKLQYSHHRDQAIVLTQSSIQVYSCGFIFQQIQLKKCMILNNQMIYSIRSVNMNRWQVFGEVFQYSNSFIQLHSIQSKVEQLQYQTQLLTDNCFVEQFQIYICSNSKGLKLFIYDHIKEIQSIVSLLNQTIQEQLVNYLKTKSTQLISSKQQQSKNKQKQSIKIKGWKLYLSQTQSQCQINNYEYKYQNYRQKQNHNVLSSLSQQQNHYHSQVLPSPKFSSSIKSNAQSIVQNNNNLIDSKKKQHHHNNHHNHHERHFSYSLTRNNNKYENYNNNSNLLSGFQKQQQQQQFILILEIDSKYLIGLITPQIIRQNIKTQNIITTSTTKNEIKSSLKSNKDIKDNSNKQTHRSLRIPSNKWQAISIPLTNRQKRQNLKQTQTILFSSMYKQFHQISNCQSNILSNQIKQHPAILCLITSVKQQHNHYGQGFRQNKQQQNPSCISSYLFHIIKYQQMKQGHNLIYTETYKIQLSSQQCKQFLQFLTLAVTNQQNIKNNKYEKDNYSSQCPTICLTNIQLLQDQVVYLSFVYYNHLVKSKALSTVRLCGKKIIYQDKIDQEQKHQNNNVHGHINNNNNNKHDRHDINIRNTTSILIQSQNNYNNKPNNSNKQHQGTGLFSSSNNNNNNIKSNLPILSYDNKHNKKSSLVVRNHQRQCMMMLQNVPLTISQSITQSRPISTSQPMTNIALTYSSDPTYTQLTNTELLSNKKPSTFSNSSNQQSDNLKHNEPHKQNIKKVTSIRRTMSEDPNKQYQSKQGQQSLINQFLNNISQSQQYTTKFINHQLNNEPRHFVMGYLTPHHMPIPQLSQQQYNQYQQTTKFQMEEIQQIVEMKDFKPTQFIYSNNNNNNNNFNNNNNNNNFNNNKNNNNKILLSSSSQSQIHQNNQQLLLLSSNQNQASQQKQLYQKFINHINIPNNHYNNNANVNNNNSDSHYQSFDTNFKLSKVSGQSYKKDNNSNLNNITRLIGGKDISQIVTNLKNLSLNTDEQQQLQLQQQSITTVQLGQEIEKKYSISYGGNRSQQLKQQPYIEGIKQQHSSQQSFLEQQCDQPTVILIDNIQLQQQQQLQQYPPSYNNNKFLQQNHNQFNDPNYPNTPGFNVDFHSIDHQLILRNPQIGIVSDNHWDNFTKKWSAQVTQRVNESQQELEIVIDSPQHVSLNDSDQFIKNQNNNMKQQSTQKVLSRQQFNNLSKKVKQFCPNPQHLTWEQAKQIENKKYTLLMKQVFNKNQQKFNYLMKEFLSQIIRQQEARLFFAEYIRSFSGKTRDILIRLYMSLPSSQENKHFMSRALSEFKLSQVPQTCLPVNKDVLQIFKYLYPSVYIEDLLKPSIGLMQQLLQSYFGLQKLPVDEIVIEDEMIDLSHPRNMLNVLLYLNEHYNLPMIQLFETYCSLLIKNDCSQIIVKMLRQQKTFQICQVPKSILQDIVQNIIVEKLKQSSSNIHWVGKTLQILECNLSPMSVTKKQRLSSILNLMDYLNLADCQYNIHSLFLLSQIKNLFIFCNTLIKQNPIVNLNKISFQRLYKQLYQITHEQNLIYYNQQLKDLIEILCEKYFHNGQVIKGFQILSPIVSISRRGFLGKMLFKYLDGRWLNRLVKKEFKNKMEFMMVFKQCFNVNANGMSPVNSPIYSQQLTMSHNMSKSRESIINNSKHPLSSITLLPHDKFLFQPSQSYLSKNCSYFKFLNIYNQSIKSIKSQQVMYVCYMDYQLAHQLATYHVIPKKEWQLFNQKLQPYIPKEEIKKLNSKNNFVFDSKLPIPQQQNQQEDNHLKFSHSQNMKDPLLFLNPSNQHNSHQHLIKSLQSMQHQQPVSKRNINAKKLNVLRSKSHSKQSDQNFKQIQNSPLLQSLQYEVNPQNIIKILKQLYEDHDENHNQKMKNFLKALSMIDRERVHIHHYEKFKLITNLQLDFKFDELIPFEVLIQHDHAKCFQIILENSLRQKLSLHNFWAIYMIVEMLIQNGQNVALMMIQKLMKQKNTINLQGIINKIVEGTKINPQKLKNIGKFS